MGSFVELLTRVLPVSGYLLVIIIVPLHPYHLSSVATRTGFLIAINADHPSQLSSVSTQTEVPIAINADHPSQLSRVTAQTEVPIVINADHLSQLSSVTAQTEVPIVINADDLSQLSSVTTRTTEGPINIKSTGRALFTVNLFPELGMIIITRQMSEIGDERQGARTSSSHVFNDPSYYPCDIVSDLVHFLLGLSLLFWWWGGVWLMFSRTNN